MVFFLSRSPPVVAYFSLPLPKSPRHFSAKLPSQRTSRSRVWMESKLSPSTGELSVAMSHRKLPVVLFDVMDTLVRDPFYEDIPAFFGMTFDELIKSKHPTAWIEFEKGLINEEELAGKFFKDSRQFDLEGLKSCMRSGYVYLEGIEGLLCTLKQNNYEMHAFTNYPIWYDLIEDKLKLSSYLSGAFCSFKIGKRKPDPEFYQEVLNQLQIDPHGCIFVDDRAQNVEAAISVGMKGLQFKSAELLRQDLSQLGVNITPRG